MALTPEEEEQLRIQNEAQAEEQSQTAGFTEQELNVADSTTREERDQLRLERDNAPRFGVNGTTREERDQLRLDRDNAPRFGVNGTTREERDQLRLERDNAPRFGVNGTTREERDQLRLDRDNAPRFGVNGTTREERDQLRLDRDNAPRLGVDGMTRSERERNQIMAVTLTDEEKRRLREDDYQNGMDGTDIPPEATPSGSETQQPAGETQQRGLTRWEQTMASMNERANQLRANELARTTAWHQQLADARERRISGNRAIAAADPGRFSSFETNALRGIQHTRNGDVPLQDVNERTGLRQHEIDIADKGIEQERVKAWGMANQGGVAAGIRAGVESDANRAQHGYFDENGNYVPGSTVRAAEANGLWKSELNENNWRNRKELKEMDEEGKNNRKQQDLDFKNKELNEKSAQKGYDRDAKKGAAEERADRIKKRQAQQDALREQKDFEAFDQKVGTMNLDLPPEQEAEYKALKTPEERKAWWKGHVGRGTQQPDNGAPKNGDRKQFKQGWGTWKDGKWVLDAQ